MMDWTDNHYMTLTPLISRHAWLYTEMVVVETIVQQYHNTDKFLEIHKMQHPIVLQIGGSHMSTLQKWLNLKIPMVVMKSISIVVDHVKE